ncbi:MAG: hypothetical protein JNM95_04450 [Chitinophagaceae bacterium]|nr:hypothetical protein [Chitinophagaceae bacterium]
MKFNISFLPILFFLFIIGWSKFLTAQNLRVDSTFGVQGVMKIASTDSFCMTVPVFDFSTKIRAIHNVYDPAQTGLNYQGAIQFKSNGLEIDTSFSADGISNYTLGSFNAAFINANSAYDLKTLKDARILLAGRRKSNAIPSIYQSTIVCMKSNGLIDSSFATNGRFIYNHLDLESRANEIHQNKENDRILVHATSGNYEHNYILAFKLNGTLDSAFGVNGKSYWYALHESGEIALNYKPLFDKTEAIFIYRSVYDSVSYNFKRNEWLKLKSNGFPDSSFGIQGIQKMDTNILANSAFITPNDFQTNCIDNLGNLYVLGAMKNNPHQALLKFKSNGRIDSSFATQGIFDIPLIPDTTYYNEQRFYCTASVQDGSILLAGDVLDTNSNNKIDGAILRLRYNGKPDSSFFQNGFFYRDLNNYNQDGFREIHSPDSNTFYFCGTAHKSALNYAQFYLAFKMKLLPFALNVNTKMEEEPMRIFPNPVTKTLYCLSNKSIGSYKLLTMFGQPCSQGFVSSTSFQVDCSGLHSGYYLFGVEQNGRWYYYRILVQPN